MTAELERLCFFIAPIGEDGSAVRRRSNGVQSVIVEEAAAAHGLVTKRADDFDESGQITSQIIRACLQARMCVADLTDGNPNVYYELSVRHGARLPVVLIAESDTRLPFDVMQSRVVFFRHDDLLSVKRARESVREQIGRAVQDGTPVDNPIYNGQRLAALHDEGGEGRGQTLLIERLDAIGATVADLDARMRAADRREAVRRELRLPTLNVRGGGNRRDSLV